MERLGQTAVLGELLAGVLIGPGALGLVRESEVLTALAELGVIILLFEIGLESDLGELLRAGVQSTAVAVVGIACPFLLGYGVAAWWGMPSVTAVFIGATLTATSVGITARVLADIGRLQDAAAKVLLGAAVLDDILGLVILAVVVGIVQTGSVAAAAVLLILLKALAFVGLAIVIGVRFAPTLLAWIGLMRVRGSLIVAAVAFCVLLAALAETIGLATIIGAFAAGLVLTETERRAHIEEALKPVADLLVPVFFVTVGMKVEPGALNPFGPQGWTGLALAGVLTAVAVVSKLVAGLAVYQNGVRRWPVAVGMVPRGEVGLIFAGIGLAGEIIDAGQYAAIVAMIMVSTFIVPPWLKAVYSN
jgi:Kef-type K+ transport system membrane component KefB